MVDAVCVELAAPAALDPTLLERAAAVVCDTVGVIVAGGQRPEMRGLAEPWRGLTGNPPGDCTVFVAGIGRTVAERAAFLNGTAGTFLELDEGTRPTGHPAVHVVPAALAAAEALHSDGREALAAILAGYEVSARLFAAYALRPPTHPHGHLGGVGAAVAVALLTGTEPLAAARVAATLPGLSSWVAPIEGATARNAWAGRAAATGIAANQMVAAGFRGAGAHLDSVFDGLVGDLADPEALAAPVRSGDLRIWRNYFKLLSACALTHTAIEAALELPPHEPGEIVAVRVRTVANNMKVAGQAEGNDLSTRFSLPYAVAASIVHRGASPAALSYSDEVAALARKVTVAEDPKATASWPRAAPSTVEIETASGVERATVDNPRGHHLRPVGADALQAKFRSLVTPVLGDDAERLEVSLLGLPASPDVGSALHWPRPSWA